MQMTIEEKHLKAVYEAILNKGYSISDFHIAYDEKTGKSVEITRKSQEITQIYKFKNYRRRRLALYKFKNSRGIIKKILK